jgi:hypothetical protein
MGSVRRCVNWDDKTEISLFYNNGQLTVNIFDAKELR